MKKLFLVILGILIIFNLGSVCFAATGNSTAAETTDITDQETAAGAAYAEEADVVDGQVPGGAGNAVDIQDQEVPKALPKTGGIPAEAFYGAGGLLIAGALVVSMKKPKASKN